MAEVLQHILPRDPKMAVVRARLRDGVGAPELLDELLPQVLGRAAEQGRVRPCGVAGGEAAAPANPAPRVLQPEKAVPAQHPAVQHGVGMSGDEARGDAHTSAQVDGQAGGWPSSYLDEHTEFTIWSRSLLIWTN